MAERQHSGVRTLAKAERLIWATHELFANRATATVGAFARDRHSHPLPLERVNDARAVRWSLMGAVLHAAHSAFEIETVVIHAPPGSGIDLTGPTFALAAIDLVEAALVELFQSKRPKPQERLSLDRRDNPVVTLLDRATPQARRFWIAVLISGLPEISRKDGVNALATAALIAETQRDELRRARKEARGR